MQLNQQVPYGLGYLVLHKIIHRLTHSYFWLKGSTQPQQHRAYAQLADLLICEVEVVPSGREHVAAGGAQNTVAVLEEVVLREAEQLVRQDAIELLLAAIHRGEERG